MEHLGKEQVLSSNSLLWLAKPEIGWHIREPSLTCVTTVMQNVKRDTTLFRRTPWKIWISTTNRYYITGETHLLHKSPYWQSTVPHMERICLLCYLRNVNCALVTSCKVVISQLQLFPNTSHSIFSSFQLSHFVHVSTMPDAYTYRIAVNYSTSSIALFGHPEGYCAL